jgi:hypothetical protein
MQNYKLGRPFPDIKPDDPKAGVKAAWNYDSRCEGDSFFTDWRYWLTDSKGDFRILAGVWKKLKFSLRTDLDPKPEIKKGNPEGIKDKSFIHFREPFASKGLTILAIKYRDPKRDKDQYIYVPGLRRITRAGAGAHCDCVGGFVGNMDDDNIFSGDVGEYTYKVLGVREMLVPWLMEPPPPKLIVGHKPGMHTISPPKLELRKVWIVEATAKNKGYCYSKRVWVMDPKSWWILIGENYGRWGGLWKSHWQTFTAVPNAPQFGGGFIIINNGGVAGWDFKINEAGPYKIEDMGVNLAHYKPLGFSLDALRRMGR